MDAELQIGNDPAVWFFDPARCDEVAAGLAPPGAPLVVEVVAPLAGRLVLNPRAAGKVALTLPFQPVGWNPSGIILPRSPLLYVSSVTGATHDAPGYTLAAGYRLATLEQDLIAAMTAGTMLNVTLEAAPPGQGVVALSGATLAYAVLCPAVRRPESGQPEPPSLTAGAARLARPGHPHGTVTAGAARTALARPGRLHGTVRAGAWPPAQHSNTLPPGHP